MKRYQVFVSSTYEDLKTERSEVFHGLLDINCIPCGMEYFPASSQTQWEYIRKIIDNCDYYVVIVAGKYGSLAPEGISYTQLEYEYARERGIPTIAFLHSDPGSIPMSSSEETPERREQLDAFKATLKDRLCKFWRTSTELKAAVITGLTHEIHNTPRTGWIRADTTSEEKTKEMLGLYQENKELKARLADLVANADISQYAQGSDVYLIQFLYRVVIGQVSQIKASIELTWDEITDSILPTYSSIVPNQYVDDHFLITTSIEVLTRQRLEAASFQSFTLTDQCVQTIKSQLVVLGYIESNGATAKITSHGKMRIARSQAILRSPTQAADAPAASDDK